MLFFVIDKPCVISAIKHKNRTAPWFASCCKTRTQTESQDSSLLVAMEAKWSRTDILKLIDILKGSAHYIDNKNKTKKQCVYNELGEELAKIYQIVTVQEVKSINSILITRFRRELNF